MVSPINHVKFERWGFGKKHEISLIWFRPLITLSSKDGSEKKHEISKGGKGDCHEKIKQQTPCNLDSPPPPPSNSHVIQYSR